MSCPRAMHQEGHGLPARIRRELCGIWPGEAAGREEDGVAARPIMRTVSDLCRAVSPALAPTCHRSGSPSRKPVELDQGDATEPERRLDRGGRPDAVVTT